MLSSRGSEPANRGGFRLTSLVVALAEAPEDPALVGGKAANLAAMLRAGFPVPGGVCITTAAYRLFVETTGLDEVICSALTELDPVEPPTVVRVANRIRGAFVRAEIPSDLRYAVLAAYHELGSPPVAIRS